MDLLWKEGISTSGAYSFPAGKWCWSNVVPTSYQCLDSALPLMQCCMNIKCPLGRQSVSILQKIKVKNSSVWLQATMMMYIFFWPHYGKIHCRPLNVKSSRSELGQVPRTVIFSKIYEILIFQLYPLLSWISKTYFARVWLIKAGKWNADRQIDKQLRNSQW